MITTEFYLLIKGLDKMAIDHFEALPEYNPKVTHEGRVKINVGVIADYNWVKEACEKYRISEDNVTLVCKIRSNQENGDVTIPPHVGRLMTLLKIDRMRYVLGADRCMFVSHRGRNYRRRK